MTRFLCALLLLCCGAVCARADDRVRITYASRSITSILPFIAVDKGDARFARRRRGVGRVEGEMVRVGVQLADIQNVRTVCTMQNGQFRLFAGLVVGQGKGFAGLDIVAHCNFRSLHWIGSGNKKNSCP